MPQNTAFSLEKVKALRAYFLKLRNGSRGKPEYDDLETTVKLTEQLIALMEGRKKPDAIEARASSEH